MSSSMENAREEQIAQLNARDEVLAETTLPETSLGSLCDLCVSASSALKSIVRDI